MQRSGLSYKEFLLAKEQLGTNDGFAPLSLPDFLFDFQKELLDVSLRKGRAAIFADCGLGKTPIYLSWCENVVRKENKPVLILTPLAVSSQTVRESEKFGIECQRSRAGEFRSKIVVTNYEQLHHFNADDFTGCVCDESSILKSFDGVRRGEITEFMHKMKYRLLCTATAAPNDYIELGTSSEALGYLGYMDMLTRFFKNDQGNAIKTRVYRQGNKDFQRETERAKWRFKGHAELPFWKWVCSWARAIRRPSDLGFKDGDFILSPLVQNEHVISSNKLRDGMLFALPGNGLREEREERRVTMQDRCEKIAQLVDDGEQALVWCDLNPEGDLLEKLIAGSVQVSGKDSDESKEEKLLAFAAGKIRVLVTKGKIGAWGLNFQNCAHETFFPSHSFEMYYQGVRRCWRFGQKRQVTIDVVATEGERGVLDNLKRKQAAADRMFDNIVHFMNDAIGVDRSVKFAHKEKVPAWL